MKFGKVAVLAAGLALGGIVSHVPAVAQTAAATKPASAAAIAAAKEILTMKNASAMYAGAVPNLVQRTRDVLIQNNLNYQKDLTEVSQVVAKQMAGREQEIGDEMAKIYATDFTEQELKDLVTFYKTPLGQKLLKQEPVDHPGQHGIHAAVGADFLGDAQWCVPGRNAQARQGNLIGYDPQGYQSGGVGPSEWGMSDKSVDLFVIGGGSGGVRASRIAAGYGASVMVAEEYRFGGTCVIRGCVPKKLMVYASQVRHDIDDAAGFGWTIPSATFDWPTFIANKDREIARLESIYVTNVEKPARDGRSQPRRARGCAHRPSRNGRDGPRQAHSDRNWWRADDGAGDSGPRARHFVE